MKVVALCPELRPTIVAPSGAFLSGGGIVRCVFCDGGASTPPLTHILSIRLVAPRCAVSPLD